MSVKRTFRLSDEANSALESLKESDRDTSYDQFVSEALMNYSVFQNRDYAEESIERIIERRLYSMENGIRSLISTVGMDVLMILVDTLQSRSDQLGVNANKDYEELRSAATVLWNRKRAAKRDTDNQETTNSY